MKNQRTALLILLCCVFAAMLTAFTGCETEIHNEKTLNSITVSNLPEEAIIIGEFDSAGITLNLNYSDGEVDYIPVTENMFPYDFKTILHTPGTNQVEILYRGLTATFTVTMREKYQWTVTFLNAIDEVVKTQVISEGEAQKISYPTAEEMAVEGYRFTGFPEVETPVTQNVTVKGEYVKTWVVKFYNGDNAVISEQIVDNGTAATEPTEEQRAVEGFTFVSWDVAFDIILKDTVVYGFYVKTTPVEPEEPNEPVPISDAYFTFTYLSDTDSYEIIAKDVNNMPAEVVLPSTHEGKPVTSIGDWAFEWCSGLTSIEIPNSVTSIGDYAFYNCSGLTSIEIPNSVTSIGFDAFEGCSGLTSVTIPNSVTSIGNYAFYYCRGLTSVTIPNSVTSIGYCAFAECSGLTSITVDPDNQKYKSENNCLIDKETNTLILGCKNSIIPNSVTSIGDWAFGDCSGLTSITIGSSVTSIGSSAFYNCSGLTTITVDPDNQKYKSENNCLIEKESNTLILGCKNSIIPNGVTSIGDEAFAYCSGLTSISIPNSVTSVGRAAFYGCSGLTSISIPNSVTSIGHDAFSGCSGLTSVTIPDSVTSIGYYAFAYCRGLTSIKIPNSVTSIGYYAFYNCSGLTSITIPNSVTSIGNSAFYNCSGLTSVSIPDSVTSIGEDAFADCNGLASITVDSDNQKYRSEGNCLIEIETNTLILGCKNSIIPNSVTSIGNSAFRGCNGLTSIEIPNSVTSIGEDAFFGCSGLTSVTIGNSVTSIGEYAFRDCSGLTTVNWNATNCTGVGSSSYPIFSGCSNLTTINIGDNVKNIPSYAFQFCSGLTSIEIPNSVTSIGSSAFSGCSGLTSVTIPDSVTSIGWYAFGYCRGLTRIDFNGTMAQWKAISKGRNWDYDVPPACKIYCTDGTLDLDGNQVA